MKSEELHEILELHKLWLNEDEHGKRADLSGANLSGANLSRANLRRANLSGANLIGANIDYSCWPLWCYSLDVRIDERIAAQLLYHWMRAIESVPSLMKFRNNADLIEFANNFHRA